MEDDGIWEEMKDDMAEWLLALCLYRYHTSLAQGCKKTHVSLVELKSHLEKFPHLKVPPTSEEIVKEVLPAVVEKMTLSNYSTVMKHASLCIQEE
mmetsp:Transcript_64964/g.125405  ORF Transcript_64964/g.125405 Transcript_64964/m.125405 type:complete len:95 (+) Transcript_64964:3-287(+)